MTMVTNKLNDYDFYLFHNGTNYFAYQMFGAHFVQNNEAYGVRFAVWAKNAKSVSVEGGEKNGF